ncbi:MAG TPA: hypothetical protein VGU73_07735 [Acidimicrobiia bacterium]|nr:hypothetical protein [Acidimicrobiia bacterium]
MSLDDGLFDEMPRRPPTVPRLDDGTAARLLAGELAPLDAPPGYAAVATLLRVAAAPRDGELDGEDEARQAFATARPAAPAPRRRRSTRFAALVVAGVLCLGGVAAAATTGSLPGPVQSVAHSALQSVGVSVPAPQPAAPVAPPVPHHAPVTAPPRRLRPAPSPRVPPPTAPPRAPPPPRTVPPHTGAPALAVLLCRAEESGRLTPHGGPQAQRAYAALVKLAGSAAGIPGYCRGVFAG